MNALKHGYVVSLLDAGMIRMPQNKEHHTEYMRNWRKQKRDEIEQQFVEQANRTAKKEQNQKSRNSGVFDDNFGREPETRLNPQYQKEKVPFGCCLWGLPQNPDNKPKKSYQQILSELDSKHSE